jgi:hypothetical protein
MKVYNAPGRYDRSPQTLAASVDQETSQPDVSAGFHTEVQDPDRIAALKSAARKNGFTTTWFGGGNGKGECAIVTKDSLRKIVSHGQHLLKLTEGGGKGRLANPIYAPTVITKAPSGRVTLLSVPHLPAHVETLWRKLPNRTKARLLSKNARLSPVLRTYLHAILEWKRQVMHLAAEHHVDDIVLGADWNLDADADWVPVLIDHVWPDLLKIVATEGPDLGKRNVGWLLTTMTEVASSVHGTKASDHRVGRFTLTHINKIPSTDKPAVPPNPFALCTYNGARMDEQTKLRVQIMERALEYALTILQGCYGNDVAASAGTHGKGGVLDFAPYDYQRKVRVWRRLFGPAWFRPAIPGLWGEHIHVVAAKGGNLAAAAARQVISYFAGRNGLADNAKDPNQYHPQVDWNYTAEWRKYHAA